MTNIEKIKAEMLSISKKTKLPEFYVEDLSKDLSLVETFSGHKLVWVLRTCGSALVPTKVGVHPTHVVIPPFLGAFKSRGHAAFARCCFGV